jgi:hypothetical protein
VGIEAHHLTPPALTYTDPVYVVMAHKASP